MKELSNWMTVNEAAEETGYNPEQIRRLARQSKIESHKWGSAWMIHRASLLEYMRTEGRGPKSKGENEV